jgi:peptide/nickel transport system ATP-binding protein
VIDLRVQFKTYRGIVKALNGISFDVRQGEMLGLAGETGSGKSVTGQSILRILPGNAKIVGGQIIFEGNDLLKLNEKEMEKIRGKEITSIFQDPHTYLNPIFRISSQFRDILLNNDPGIKAIKNRKEREKAIKEKMVNSMKEVRMPSPERIINSFPHELSGGMKQRMLIAMAFSLQPKLIIADEPTTALDVTIQAQVILLMRALQKKYNTSVILITHDLGLIAENCDRIAIMYAGRIVEFGDVMTVYSKPLHPYTMGLMKALPRADRDMALVSIGGTVPDLVSPPKGCTFHERCPYAMGICNEVTPEPMEYEGRVVECHLYDEVLKKGFKVS